MQYEIRIMSTQPQTCPLATRNPSFLLFSEELFSDTRLSQQPTGSVHLHIEDWLAGVQRSSRQKKPLKMQNKPNFRKAKMNINSAITKNYENISPIRKCQNKPKRRYCLRSSVLRLLSSDFRHPLSVIRPLSSVACLGEA